jgi:hypothetical protein
MDSPLTEQQMTEVREALFQGNKIAAIKIYRQAAGTELSVAKSAVDAIEKELRQTAPESFQHPERRGSLGLVLICLGFGVGVMYSLSR